MVLIGNKRQRVTIERNDESATGSFGDRTPAWVTVATRWASVVPLRGREYLAAHQVQAEVTHRIFLRHDSVTSAVTPKHRLKIGARVFDVLSAVDIEERGREVEIMAVERL